MRPTLTQAILAAFCAILCNLSALGGGGMMLGARTACWSGGKSEPSAADYVQTGILALYDGKENYSWGQHSSEKVCNNLIDGQWNGIVGADVVIGENYFEFDGQKRESSAIKIGREWFGKPSFMTAEICFVSTGAGAQGGQCAMGGTETGESGFSFHDNQIYFKSLREREFFPYGFSWKSDVITRTIGFACGSDHSFSFCNGNKISEVEGSEMDWRYVTGRSLYIGADAYAPIEFVLKGKIYSVRIYGRKLGEDEILLNHQIDKARFGIA